MAPQPRCCNSHLQHPGPKPRRSISKTGPLRRSARITLRAFSRTPPLLRSAAPAALPISTNASDRHPAPPSPPSYTPATPPSPTASHSSSSSKTTTPSSLARHSSSPAPSPSTARSPPFPPAHAELIPLAWFSTPLARDSFFTRFVDRPIHACEIVSVNSFPTDTFPFITYLLRSNCGKLMDLGHESYPQLVRMFYANARPTKNGSVITLDCQVKYTKFTLTESLLNRILDFPSVTQLPSLDLRLKLVV